MPAQYRIQYRWDDEVTNRSLHEGLIRTNRALRVARLLHSNSHLTSRRAHAGTHPTGETPRGSAERGGESLLFTEFPGTDSSATDLQTPNSFTDGPGEPQETHRSFRYTKSEARYPESEALTFRGDETILVDPHGNYYVVREVPDCDDVSYSAKAARQTQANTSQLEILCEENEEEEEDGKRGSVNEKNEKREGEEGREGDAESNADPSSMKHTTPTMTSHASFPSTPRGRRLFVGGARRKSLPIGVALTDRHTHGTLERIILPAGYCVYFAPGQGQFVSICFFCKLKKKSQCV